MRKNRLVLVLALLAASFSFAQSLKECEKDCADTEKEGIEGCTREVKKINPATVKFCKPKCQEVTKECKKDCKDEAKGNQHND